MLIRTKNYIFDIDAVTFISIKENRLLVQLTEDKDYVISLKGDDAADFLRYYEKHYHIETVV